MTRIIKVKNNSGFGGTWLGVPIANGLYYQIPDGKVNQWILDNKVFTDIGSGNLIVNKGTDIIDDIVNPISGWQWFNADEAQLDVQTGKHTFHESSRPMVPGKTFRTVWTGAGDDMVTPIIGGGSTLSIQTAAGNPTTVADVQFHKNFGDVYIHEGYVQWENAGWGDTIDVEIYASATPLQQVANLDYTIDAGVKIRVAPGGPGTGTDGLNGDPVWVPNKAGTGWWDTDGTNATFSSTQTGAYDWYNIEVLANRFMNKVPIYGTSTSYIMLQSADVDLLPNGYIVRITANNFSNTAWKAWIIMTIYREQTV